VIAPGKRMLSSQTPVIVARDGRPVLITGSPGGRTIINTVFCVLLNTLVFDLNLDEAIGAPRMHHQWLPDQIRLEQLDDPRFESLIKELRARGHKVVESESQGDAHSIFVDPKTGQLHGVADTRIGGRAMGF
jgi:gamma-glutamyltranspeptidase/glutathione hydrolase